MASYKIVQNIGEFTFNATPVVSDPIALKSGYLRIANGSSFCHVAIGTGGAATSLDFGIPANQSVVLKERVSSQHIAGITTGVQTTIQSPEGGTPPFNVGDYIAINNVSTSGINTDWARVVSILGRNMVLDWNTSGVVGPINFTNGETRRCVKLSFLGEHGGTPFAHVSEVQIAGS